MKRSNKILTLLLGTAGSARSFGRRIKDKAAVAHVPHWSEYLRETRNR